jgi:RNA polymerase sigma factor (sigma-70 family)
MSHCMATAAGNANGGTNKASDRFSEAFALAFKWASRYKDVDFDTAEEIAAKVQESVWQSTLADPSFLDGPGELDRFVLIAVRNRLNHLRRSAQNRRNRETAHEVESHERHHRWMCPDAEDDAEDEAADAELSDAIEKALASTPPRRRRAWLLVHVEEMSYEAAAAKLKIPVRTLESRIRNTKKKLREELAAYRKAAGWKS